MERRHHSSRSQRLAASLAQARERMTHARDFVVEGTLSRMWE